jgi:hypothetical protein
MNILEIISAEEDIPRGGLLLPFKMMAGVKFYFTLSANLF